MKMAFVRLALLQMTFIFYSILGVGLILKLRYGSPAPTDLFATHVRDYGFLLMLFPAAWCIWVIYEEQKPASNHRTAIGLFGTGFIVAGLLAAIAFFATMSAIVHNSLIQVSLSAQTQSAE
ncbi:MAG: hypothetical protein WCD79_18915 [Chthoniobacteraceae bacterium]